MKLLFDENLSAQLPRMLANEYPGSKHVEDAALLGADDREIWDYARAQGFIIVSKDSDFRERGLVEGFPPKIIWLDVGNAGTGMIAELMRQGRSRVEAFWKQDETSFLILSFGASGI